MSTRIPISRLCRPLPRLRPRAMPGRARAERTWRERRHIRRRREMAAAPRPPLVEATEIDPPIGG